VRRAALLLLGTVLFAGTAFSQIPGDQLGVHDLTPAGVSPVKGGVAASCLILSRATLILIGAAFVEPDALNTDLQQLHQLDLPSDEHDPDGR